MSRKIIKKHEEPMKEVDIFTKVHNIHQKGQPLRGSQKSKVRGERPSPGLFNDGSRNR